MHNGWIENKNNVYSQNFNSVVIAIIYWMSCVVEDDDRNIQNTAISETSVISRHKIGLLFLIAVLKIILIILMLENRIMYSYNRNYYKFFS